MKIWQIVLVSCTLGVTLPAVAQMVGRTESRADVEARVSDQLKRFDKDSDGVVTREEILAYGQAKARERADKLFGEIDKDGNGSVSKAEFAAYYGKRADAGLERIAGGTGDGDRIVIVDAIKAALMRFDAADANHDGMLTPEERRARAGATPRPDPAN